MIKPALMLRRGRVGDPAFLLFSFIFSFILIAIFALIVIKLFQGSWLSLKELGWGFVSGTTWDPVRRQFGTLPLIYGTLVSSFLALLLAVPISLGAALFLAELAPSSIRGPISYLIELLAAIPSVILGFWGLLILAPFLRTAVQPWLGDKLGFVPLFQGPPLGIGMLTAGMVLAIMLLPIITSISKEVIMAVPAEQREAMLALGATKWETIWGVVLPCARSGIIGAIILGLGRALGETMVVAMLIGNKAQIKLSLFAPGATLTSAPANEFVEADFPLYISALIGCGLLLLFITLAVNIMARLLILRAGYRGI